MTRTPVTGNLYFDHKVLERAKVTPAALSKVIREWAMSTGKYVAVFDREELLLELGDGEHFQRIRNGYYPDRSGDMVLVYKPYTFSYGKNTGTTHGSPFPYDTHVPVIFYGPPFKPGKYAEPFKITDLAPTLSAAMQVPAPKQAIGKAFEPALAK